MHDCGHQSWGPRGLSTRQDWAYWSQWGLTTVQDRAHWSQWGLRWGSAQDRAHWLQWGLSTMKDWPRSF